MNGGNPGWYDNVDWPIRYVWINQAEVDKVKNKVDGVGGDPNLPYTVSSDFFASPVHLKMVVHPVGEVHDSDKGKKHGTSCGWDQHMRFYAENTDDQNGYNQAWGYWILSSSHRDWEWLGSGLFCSSTYTSTEGGTSWPEETEYWWNVRIITINGLINPDWTIQTNSQYFANVEMPGHYGDATHFVESNGWGSIITVP